MVPLRQILLSLFNQRGGRPSEGITDAEGKYELVYTQDVNGAKVGKNLVTLSSNESSENYEAENNDDQVDGENAQDSSIPAKYNTEAKDNPEMTVEVKPGSNEFNWAITTGE